MSTIDRKNYHFSPSVNIVRDNGAQIDYILTPNAELVHSQLVTGFQIGIRAYNLIGAYGTGKSAFLKAFENDIINVSDNFQNKSLTGFDFIKFIGEYTSFKRAFADFLNVENPNSQNIIKAINDYYSKLNSGLIILVDEFGKFLEYAAQNNPEEELYFIQELAEYVNDKNKNILFISTLHQDFNQYAFNLSQAQKNEWDKVKGRLKEITFNEPVEQLLFLAAKRIDKLEFETENNNYRILFKVIQDSKLFPLRDYFNGDIGGELFPLDVLSASVLALSLQKYGQNERSLFSFLDSNDPYNLFDYDQVGNPYFNVACVYDYLIHNYYSFLTTKYNPHYSQWTNIRASIEMTDGSAIGSPSNAVKIVKTIGLLNLFGNSSGSIDEGFIEQYAKFSLGIDDAKNVINELLAFRILRYVGYSNRFVLAQGTDLDIEKALNEASFSVEKPSNITDYIRDYFTGNYIAAKSIYYTKGTPRFFEFRIIEKLISEIPAGEVDGFINLIFSNDISEKDVVDFSQNNDEAILIGYYQNYAQIQEGIYEILKIQKIKGDYLNDKIALNELGELELFHKNTLNKLVNEDLYSNSGNVKWYYKGQLLNISSSKSLNRKLSRICDEDIYTGTPVFRNEMVNKTKISSPISTAKKVLLRNLADNWQVENLGFDSTHFPPEKTIYLSLLKETGIHRIENGLLTISRPTDNSYDLLWELGEKFLESSKYSKRNLQDFIELMSVKPFKLKQGFIDFWLPIFLFIKRNDFALFYEDTYIPELTFENLELVSKKAKDYEIKAFDVEGVKLKMFNQYREMLEQTEKDTITNQSFIETVKPFLKFYREIPDYSKKTLRLGRKALKLRDAIANSKDPEKTFFEDFPSAMEVSIVQLQNDTKKLEQYISEIQSSIREIRTSYSGLIERFENYILNEIVGENLVFEEYKTKLQNRFKNIKKHLLKPNHKVFVQRLSSPLDDKNAWLNSLVQVCLGKTLDKITDDEEAKLYTIFTDTIAELDNLSEISQKDFDETTEEIFKIEITSFVDGLKKNLVRLPKEKTKEISEKEIELKKLLVDDTRINITILANLLQEQLKK
ncbi:hypothetical protein ACM40_15760 [Chryseobacterium sp. BLS98]|uniref:hypothetical protein n=1 Tax=Chryseobacterium sp. BLS98 TaxID=885586 RepID=UPI00065AF72C|nr:hypothetical protein [Chryseobacterium sp. BLS98]KMQ61149.1 hypothetical protein ACM40_15760 [Chryseobacterium sp. BLS98]